MIKSNRYIFLCLLGFAMSSNAIAASGQNEAMLRINGFIEAGTCVVNDDSTRFISLGEISSEKIVPHKNITMPNSGGEIRVECPSGTAAKFNFAAVGEKCVVDSGDTYSCDGPNKSVGITPSITWEDSQGKKITYRVFHNAEDSSRVNEIGLKDKVGVVKIKEVQLRKAKDVELMPGELGAIYKITVFNM